MHFAPSNYKVLLQICVDSFEGLVSQVKSISFVIRTVEPGQMAFYRIKRDRVYRGPG